MTTTSNLPIHPIANIIPPMTRDEYDALKSDMKTNGQLEDIVTYEQQVLDGKHRLYACIDLKREPTFQELPDGIDPVAFVIGKNLKRRHLSREQRDAVMQGLRDRDMTTTAIAAALNVDPERCNETHVESGVFHV